jgi:hypothetical protein
MSRYKLRDLTEFLIVAGPERSIVRAKIVPLLEGAGPEAGAIALELLRENEWRAPSEVCRIVVQRARQDPELAGILVHELLLPDCPDVEMLS